MAPILAPNALTTLDIVKADLGLSVPTYDSQLIRLINSASASVESRCGRTFARDTAIEEKRAGYGLPGMRLARPPIHSVAGVVFDESTTVDPDDYSIRDANAGILDRTGGWADTSHAKHDISGGPVPGTERLLYTVTYDGGWYTRAQSRAQGTITLSGVPTADDTLTINQTAHTAKATGAVSDQFNIGADARITCDNLAAAINAGSESGNVRAWRFGSTVVVEWLEGGLDGNSVVFTVSMANATIDGAGTLGTTQAGVARTLPDDLEDAVVDLVRMRFLSKRVNPAVSAEHLMSWGATYGGAGGGMSGGIPQAIATQLDRYVL